MKKKFFIGLLIAIAFILPLFFGNFVSYAETGTSISKSEIDFENGELDKGKINNKLKDSIEGNIGENATVDGQFIVLKNFKFYTYSDVDFKSSGLINSASKAKICNIIIDGAEFIINTDYATTTDFGILVGKAENTEISNIKIINSTIKIEGTKKISQLNIGGLVGSANNCKINNIEITNLKFVDENSNAISVNTSLNFGACCGIAYGNSEVKNAIFDSILNAGVSSSYEETINVGGVIGYTDSAKIYNVIEKLNANVNVQTKNSKVCIGGLVGFSQGENIEYVNNASLLFAASSNSSNKFFGSIVGRLDKNMMPNFGKIKFFKTVSSLDFFGNNGELTYNYDIARLIKELSSDSFTKSSFYANSEWDPSSYWDLMQAWDFVDASSIPSLQAFNTFNFSFSETDSLGTLGLNKMPTYIKDNVNQKIIKAGLNGDNDKSVAKINYGSEFYFRPQIELDNKYNKFFYITGVRQNGQNVFMISDYLNIVKAGNVENSENATNKTYTLGTKKVVEEKLTGQSHELTNPTRYSSNFNDFIYEVDDQGNMCFSIKNVNKSYEGTYSVALEKYKYKLQINALKGTNNEETGKVMLSKEINTDKAQEKIIQEVEYGLTYSFTAVPNEDYSDIVNWKMRTEITVKNENNTYTYDDNGQYKKFGEAGTQNYKTSNILEFTFDENSELGFKDLLGDEVSKENENYLGISIDLEFTNNIRIVRFEYVVDGKNADEDVYQNAKLYVSGTLLELKDGELVRKLIIGSEYVLSVSIPQDYSFNQWRVGDSTQPYQTSDYCKINVSDGSDELVISVVLKKAEKNVEVNLTWLYITLGGLGGAGLIVLIIIVIKKRKKDDSYKNMLY